MNDDDDLIDMEGVCTLLGGAKTPLHRATIFKHIRTGKLPKPLKIGGGNRWLKSEILAVIERAKLERDAA